MSFFRRAQQLPRAWTLDSWNELFKVLGSLDLNAVEAITENERVIWKVIPRFDFETSQLKYALQELTSKPRDVLSAMKYTTEYQRDVVEMILRLICIPDRNPKDLLVAAMFQLLSRLYISPNPIDKHDFSLFMRIAKQHPAHRLSILMFDCLMKSSANKFELDEKTIRDVSEFFLSEKSVLDAEFCDILASFVDSMFLSTNITIRKMAVDLIYDMINEKSEVTKGNEIALFLGLLSIDTLLFAWHEKAILLTGLCANNLPNDSLNNPLDVIVNAYRENVMSCMKEIESEEGTKLHELPYEFKDDISACEKEMVGEDTTYTLAKAPEELESRELVLSERVVKYNRVLRKFLACLNDEKMKEFINLVSPAFKFCTGSDRYRVLAAFVSLVNEMESQRVIESTFEIVFDDVMFDPKRTIYGPISIDNEMNRYRVTALNMIMRHSPHLMAQIIRKYASCPFMMAELSARLVHSDFDLSKISDVPSIKALGNNIVALRMLGSSFEPRMAIVLLLYAYVKKHVKVEGRSIIAHSYFADVFIRCLYERGMTNIILLMLNRGFTEMNENDISQLVGNRESPRKLMAHTVSLLITFIRNVPSMKRTMFKFVIDVLSMCPRLVYAFNAFADLMMESLESDGTEMVKDTLLLLGMVSSAHSDFKLTNRYYETLCRYVTEDHYTELLNLVGRSHCIRGGSLFHINRPCFLPLFFVALGRSRSKMDKFLMFLKHLTLDKSLHNVKRLHEGDVDGILLKYLRDGSTITHIGVKFEIHASKKLVLELLEIISPIVASHSIARKFIQVIQTTKDKEIISILEKILIKSSHQQYMSYPFGTIPRAGYCNDISHTHFNNAFTLSFSVFNDQSVMSGSTAIVDLVSFEDIKHNKVSVSFLNNIPYAIREGDGMKSLVSLFPRMSGNTWSHFVLCFQEVGDDKSLISIIKDGEALHDSEFVSFQMESGPVKLSLGGYSYDNRMPVLPETEFGMVANVIMYPRILTDAEISAVIAGTSIPNDYVFNTNNPRGSITFTHSSKTETMLHAMGYAPNVRKLALTYEEIEDPKLLSILGMTLAGSTDRKLPLEMASLLMKKERTYKLYGMMFNIIKKIRNTTVQMLWFENVLINCDMWDVNDNNIMTHWNTVLLSYFRNFFTTKSYFRYFIEKLVHPKYEAIVFIIRLGKLALEQKDAAMLLSTLFKYKDNPDDVCSYLSIIKSLGKEMMAKCCTSLESLLLFMHDENVRVVRFAVEAFASIKGEEFCVNIPAIMDRVRPSQELIDELELSFPLYPDVFLLTCALGVKYNNLKISTVVGEISIYSMWYLYPVLLYVKSEGEFRQQLAQFLSLNSIRSSHQQTILFLVMLLSEYAVCADFDAPRHLISSMLSEIDLVATRAFPDLIISLITVSLFRIKNIGYVHHSAPLLKLMGESEAKNSSLEREEIRDERVLLNVLEKCVKTDLFYSPEISDTDYLDKMFLESAAELSKRTKGIAFASHDNTLKRTVSLGFVTEGRKNDYTSLSLALQLLLKRKVELSHDSLLNILETMQSSVRKGYETWRKTLTSAVGNFNRIVVAEPLQIELQGRTSGVINITRIIEHKRDHVLSGHHPVNIVRVKQQDIVPNLLTVALSRKQNGEHIVYDEKKPICLSWENRGNANKESLELVYLNGIRVEMTTISFTQVNRVVYVNPSTLLFIMNTGKPYLISLLDQENTTIIKEIKERHPYIQLVESPEDAKAKIQGSVAKWRNREITSFEFISQLNELSGRTYEYCANYPLFPSLDCDFSMCNDMTPPDMSGTLFNQLESPHTTSNGLLELPELYYFSDAFSAEVVYQNRKQLEAREDLEKWVNKVFSMRIEPRIPRKVLNEMFIQVPLPARDSLKKETMIFCHTVTSTDANSCPKIVCVYDSGRVAYTEVNLHNARNLFESKLKNPKSYKYFGTRPGFVIHDGTHFGVMNVYGLSFEEKPLRDPWFNSDVCRVSPTSVMRYTPIRANGGVHRTTFEELARLPERITCIASTRKFHITAIGCEDGKLRIRQNGNSSKLATVDLDGEVPTSIIITQSWGFIVVKTNSSTFVFTVNGKLVKKVAHSGDFNILRTFMDRDGTDFIVFANESSEICYFEAVDPSNVKTVIPYRITDAIELSYDPYNEVLLVICSTGKVFAARLN